MKKKYAAMAVLILAPLTLIAAACGDTTTQVERNGDGMTGITVTGEGKVTAAPDVALLTLGVSSLRPTVAEAREQAATALTAMIASMSANGVEEDDIQTQQLSIQPEYDYNNNETVLRGFRVSNTVTAKIRNIDDTTKVVDDAVTAGGDDTQIQSISFTIDDPKQLQEQAREQAVEDARAKAQTLAGASGVDLGEPITIVEGGGLQPPIPYQENFARGAADSAQAETPIQPGELDVIINVSVTWGIN